MEVLEERELRGVFEAALKRTSTILDWRGLKFSSFGYADIESRCFVISIGSSDSSKKAMRLINTSRYMASGSACRRRSYLEIFNFVRARHHGITQIQSSPYLKRTFRTCTSLQDSNQAIQKDHSLRKTLDDFKATIRPTAWSRTDTFNPEHFAKKENFGKDVEIFGWLSVRRDVNKRLTFTMLRNKDQTCCIQLVSTSNTAGSAAAEAHERLRSLKEWTPVIVRGKIVNRQAPKEKTFLGMTLIAGGEIAVQHVEPLNSVPQNIVIKEDTVFGPEQRYLQLRTDRQLRENLMLRSNVMAAARMHLAENAWEEVETPILFKSTPEGAREFLVPTRQKGLAYALPQSPQQYKQILMASGVTSYYQFARCFRDEDLRADRQPEFTQLDMEMSFASEEDIMIQIEELLRMLWSRFLSLDIPRTFPKMTYQEAMSLYGSDKPDLRFKSEIINITQHLPPDFISKVTSLQNPTIDAFKIQISDDPRVTRKFISNFLDSPDGKVFLDNPDGQPGIFISNMSAPMQGLGPLGYQYSMEGPESLTLDHGDLLVVQARPNAPLSGGSTSLGNLRLALYKAAVAQRLLEPPHKNDFKFVWITDFPLFTPSNDAEPGQGGTAGFSSTHHPFTAPKSADDVELLLTAPEEAIAAHYDIVVNGVELGGGSRRIHNAAMQEFIFRDILQMRPERIEDFRHLLDALRSGCPPHAGIALGFDRLLAVMCGTDSVRDVIAFPKSGRGEDIMVKSPNRMTEEQLDTYHLRLKE